jgi:hypothetical protein
MPLSSSSDKEAKKSAFGGVTSFVISSSPKRWEKEKKIRASLSAGKGFTFVSHDSLKKL